MKRSVSLTTANAVQMKHFRTSRCRDTADRASAPPRREHYFHNGYRQGHTVRYGVQWTNNRVQTRCNAIEYDRILIVDLGNSDVPTYDDESKIIDW